MRFKNLTPFRCALRPTSPSPGLVEASLVLRGAFRLAPGVLAPLSDEHGLAQGNLRGESFDEDDLERGGEARYPGDFADWKLNAEVLFVGSAHAPKAAASKEFPVKIALGSWSKALVFSGPRSWTKSLLGDVVGAANAVVSQRLDWSTAFGGPDIPENPAGCNAQSGRAPLLEYADRRCQDGRNTPAGYGPISSNWPARVALRGSRYDAEYRRTRAPYYPIDFDGRYFHAAPKDQQLDGFLRGDERLSLVNLHPRHAVLDCILPGERPRVFLKGDVLREVSLVLDTVFIDGESETVFLSWRGRTPAADPELRDLRLGLVASEPLAEPPRPRAHYEALFAAFEADPLGAEEVRAQVIAAAESIAQELPGGGEAKSDDVLRLPGIEALNKFSPTLARKFEGQAAAASASLPKEGEAKRRVDEALEAPAPSPVEARRKRASALTAVRGELTKARAAAAKNKAPAAALASLDAMLQDPRLDEAEKMAVTLAVPEEHELVPGAKLAGRDLSHMDLREKDLSGADLSDADLSEAQLDGAKFVGATLDRARMIKTSLQGADFSDASAKGTVWVEVSAAGARFDGATLDNAVFSEAELTGASLRKVKATLLVFSNLKAENAVFDEAVLVRALFQGGALRGASFRRARLTDCPLHACEAESADFFEARLDGSSFNEAQLTGANFRAARGVRCSFFKATLERADFRRALLSETHFSEAVCQQTRFYAADLRRSRFRLSDLSQADFRHANLFCADLGRANLRQANFADANLYGAQLLAITGEGAHFVGANLKTARTGLA